MRNILHLNKSTKYLFSCFLLGCLLLGVICLVPPQNYKHVQAAETITRVYDYAKLLSSEESSQIEALAESYYLENSIHFLIVTTSDRSEFPVATTLSEEKQTESFGLSVYNYFKDTYKEDTDNCVILTLDMSNRNISVIGQGKASTNMDNVRESMIAEKLVSYMKKQDYLKTCQTFMKLSNHYLQVKPGIDPEAIYLKLWFQILISVLLGGIVVGIMAINSGGKITTTQRTYLDEEHSNLLARRDRYIRTSVTRRKRETNHDTDNRNDNNSGGGNHGSAHF